MNIYDPRYVAGLFDEMAQSYGITNLISSLGFTYRWRRDCIAKAKISDNSRVVDLMSGMGESSAVIMKMGIHPKSILAIDLSSTMCDLARDHMTSLPGGIFRPLQGDALKCPIEDNTVDHVVSTFGLKTLIDCSF